MKNAPLSQIAGLLQKSCRSHSLVTQFEIDSRKVEKGALFFALKGEKVDGHTFLGDVAQRGGIGAVVSQEYTGPDYGLTLVRVANVLEALHTLAKESMRLRKEKVVGITGSMGKTTVKEFCATLLEGHCRLFKSFGNYNSQRTFPLNILNIEGDYDVLVLEMAMSERGQIRKLTEIAPPDIGLITRIAPAGMAGAFLHQIAEAKAEMFSQSRTKWGVISCQAALFPEALQAGGVPKWIYGWESDFDDPRLGDFVMRKKGNDVEINDSPRMTLPFEAAHLAENFLAAVAVARALGASWDHIAARAQLLKPFERRFEKIERSGITFIQDCYNANPDSVLAALKNLPKAKGKTIGVLGEMPDLGNFTAYYHEKVGREAKNYVDQVFCLGNAAKKIAAAFGQEKGAHFEDFALLKEALFAQVEPGDVVLIKGANALQLWKLLEE